MYVCCPHHWKAPMYSSCCAWGQHDSILAFQLSPGILGLLWSFFRGNEIGYNLYIPQFQTRIQLLNSEKHHPLYALFIYVLPSLLETFIFLIAWGQWSYPTNFAVQCVSVESTSVHGGYSQGKWLHNAVVPGLHYCFHAVSHWFYDMISSIKVQDS